MKVLSCVLAIFLIRLSVCVCSYQLTLLKPSTKALSQANKVCIRTDARGFLSLQYMIRFEDGQICFVEYLVSLLPYV